MTDKLPMVAKWVGDDTVLEYGCDVLILATDIEDPQFHSGRQACWVRYWPHGEAAPMYRSCDLTDLEIPADLAA